MGNKGAPACCPKLCVVMEVVCPLNVRLRTQLLPPIYWPSEHSPRLIFMAWRRMAGKNIVKLCVPSPTSILHIEYNSSLRTRRRRIRPQSRQGHDQRVCRESNLRLTGTW